MTAHIICAYEDHLVAYSDGATYDDAGIFRAPKSKVDTFPNINAMLTTRGSGDMGEMLKVKLSYAPSFAELLAALPTALMEIAMQAWAVGGSINLEAIIAGLREEDGKPVIFTTFIAGDSPFDLQDESLELREVGPFYATPGLNQEQYEAAGLPAKETCGTAEEFYIAYMEAMRCIPRKMHRKNDLIGCNVGAFVQKTALGRDEVGSRIVYRWPDVIGQPLGGFQPYVEKEEAA